jgi:hypothetical protein
MPTAVVVLKAKGTRPAETLRLPGVELRHEPEHRRVVVHQNGSDIACICTDEVERWFVEPE